MPLYKQVLYGLMIVLPLEFIVGLIVNVWFKWDVWDYSSFPFNILGQSSLLFTIIFIPVIILAIGVDDLIRYKMFGEKVPTYRFF